MDQCLSAVAPVSLDNVEYGEQVVIGCAVVHIDAADADLVQWTGGTQQILCIHGDFVRRTLQHAHRTEAQIQERVGQRCAAGSHIRAPADVSERQIQFGVGGSYPMHVVATVVDAEGLNAPGHALFYREMKLAIAAW